MHAIWDALLYKPFVNALAFLVSIVPGGDLGLAIIILTILVKVILFPLSQRGVENQAKMAKLAPELNKIKANGANKEEQARQTLELYKRHKTNPFGGCLLLIIQIPIIFALYYVFYKGLNFDSNILYSFIQPPKNINMMFLGLVDISQKSMFLAILAGASQYLQAHYMPKPQVAENAGSFQESFTKSMHLQMKYILPIIVTFVAYSISGAIALYWVVSNIFAICQQIYANKKRTLIQYEKK